MLTHLIKSINWIDVALAFLLIRMIFVGVKNGFISEFFKFLGIVTAVFVSFHYYAFLAAKAAEKTNFSLDCLNFVIFAGLWIGVLGIFKIVRQGAMILFKAETNHQGFDKYAAGIMAVARGILVCSLMIFLILLAHNGPLARMTLRSYGYKIAGHAGLGTYSFLYNNFVSKLFAGEHYNTAAAQVLRPDGYFPKVRK